MPPQHCCMITTGFTSKCDESKSNVGPIQALDSTHWEKQFEARCLHIHGAKKKKKKKKGIDTMTAPMVRSALAVSRTFVGLGVLQGICSLP